MIRIALDTNILVYLAGIARTPDDADKIGRTRSLIERLAERCQLVAPVQTLGELFVVLRRSGASPAEARTIMLEVAGACGAPASESTTAAGAADLVVDHKLQYWDALIITAAAEAGCTLLLSEDMQHGFVTRGLTIVSPLAAPTHPKLVALLDA